MICMQVGALKIDLGGTEHGILLDSDFGGVDWWSELSGGGGHTAPQLSPIGSCKKRKKRKEKGRLFLYLRWWRLRVGHVRIVPNMGFL